MGTRTRQLRGPEHAGIRNFCRLLGPLMIVAGIVMFGLAIHSFVGNFNKDPFPFEEMLRNVNEEGLVELPETPEKPNRFWMAFVGVPLMGLGTVLTRIGFLGVAARYVAGETAPVAADAFDYVARESRDGIRTVTSAVAEGLRGEQGTRVVCPKCDRANDDDAKFCSECGESLPTDVRCPSCSVLNDPDAKFCDSCGVPL
ncbi:MAG: zinc ribbon domain-containing protein [Planctomycetota bacterium]|jgi:hypothetical protein